MESTMAEPTQPTDFSSIEEWQLDEIRKGLQEAEAGDFASDEEVAEVFSRLKGA
jgi:predicted transcriptional regulator